MLNYRGISNSANCRSCHGNEETLLHCLRDCAMASRIWRHLGFNVDPFFQQTEVLSWLKQGASGPDATLFIACVWWIWKYRNAICFNNEAITFPRLLLSIQNLDQIFKICFRSETSCSTPIR